MGPQAQLVMILWLPIILYLFKKFPPRKAVIVSFLGGLLFLPRGAGFKLPLIPDYGGMFATCYGIFIGILIYDAQILRKFQLKWIDLPMILFGVSPLFSSLSNFSEFSITFALYDGLNQSIAQIVRWGMPYFLGRLYLNNLSGLKELAINIVKAGLLYVPLCLYEIRMSPQLQGIIYGSSGFSRQAMRLGGWRPVVFMNHGLMVGLFMMTATLIAIWLWQGKVVAKIWGIPIEWVSILLLITSILVKSTGAYILMLVGLIILFSAKSIRTNLPLLLLMFSIVAYLAIAASGNFNGGDLVSLASDYTSPERAGSLEFRFDNEVILGERARERILFGWGGWGRNRVLAENWAGEMEDISTTDSMWIIIFGNSGLVGLVSWATSFILPVLYFSQSYPANTWFNPRIAPAAVLGVSVILFFVDSLLNAMFNPMFPLILGGLSGLVITQPQLKRKKVISQINRKTIKKTPINLSR
jgi:hypothetical protein